MASASRCCPSGAMVRSRGFSLIELLVAVLVMGIGVLGVTGLQMVSLQNNRMALERGEAVHLAYDMMDRVRANEPGVDYDIDVGNGPPAVPASLCLGAGANCNAAAMRDLDLASWKCLLGEYRDEDVCAQLRAGGAIAELDAQPGLPGGDGSVDVDGAPPGVVTVTVTVQWTGMDGDLQSVVIDSQ